MASDFNLSANLSVRKQAPLDDRLAKLTKADLINPDTWASDNGTYYVYDYMIVGTADGVFMLTDKANVLSESAWEQVGGAELTDEQISEIIGGALQDALSGYVQKEEGKGLSTNDYTNEDKAKLDGLSNYDDTLVNTRVGALERALETLTSQNLNTTIESFNEIVAFLSNIEDTQTLEGIVNGINQAIANVQAAIPTKVSQLDNDSGFLTEHQDISGLATKKELATKQDIISDLEAIREGASRTIPTKTSELTNDSGYITADEVPTPDLSEYVTETELEERLADFTPEGGGSSEEVEELKASKAEAIDVVNSVVYLFPSQAAKQAFKETGEATYLDSASFELVDKVIELTNVSGNNNPYFTQDQSTATIEISWRSLVKPVLGDTYTEVYEDAVFSVQVDRGSTGEWTTIEQGVTIINGQNFSIDVKKYLSIGANRVQINAVGSTSKATGQINITANLTSMYLKAANFTWYTPIIEGQTYNFGGLEIGGSLSKTLNIKVSGNEYEKTYTIDVGTNQYINTAYYFNGIEFPSTGTGVYDVDIWLNAQTIESTHLKYKMMFIASADVSTAQLVVVSSVLSKAQNYTDNSLFQYAVYNQGSASASPTLVIDAVIKSESVNIIHETLTDVPTSSAQSYVLSMAIESDEESFPLTANLTFGNTETIEYVVDNSRSFPATSGASVYLNMANRSNAQENKESIINSVDGSTINATWTNVAFADGVDGWTTDEVGRKCLVLPARTKCVIDLTPLSTFGNGKTIEFTYKVRNIADYNEPIISICDDPTSSSFRGLKIRPTNVLLHSRDLQADLVQGIDVNEEVEINVIITLIKNYKVTYGNLAQIFINGNAARSFEFTGTDSWVTNGKIILGGDASDLYVYNVRVYDIGFEKLNAEKNHLSSLADVTSKEELRAKNDSIRDDLGKISYEKCYGKYNTIRVRMLDGAELPHHGLSKEYSAYCDVEFSFVDLPKEYKQAAWAFILYKCQISGQGTTSMNYYLWNLRWRLDKSKEVIIVYLNGEEVGTISI